MMAPMKTDLFNLDKMDNELIENKAHYFMRAPGIEINMNELIGKDLKLVFSKEINCTHCQKKINKTYAGGYCYPCSIKLAECDMCILKPELCHLAKGTCREPEWGQANCMIDHYVYLANSSGLKVGITKHKNIPHRWIDQGATQALPILKVSTRLQSGIFETLFKEELNDKTDWRKMLKGVSESIDLEEKRDEIFEIFGDDIDRLESEFGSENVHILEHESLVDIEYPVLSYPDKVSSLSFDKEEVVEGKLQGIKGQYLIFDTGVINIRSHTGYKIHMEY